MKNFQCDENSLIMNNETSTMWWKFITMIFITHYDENVSLSCKFISMIKIHVWYKDLDLWWKLTFVMKIYHYKEKTYHHDKDSSLNSCQLQWCI